MQRALVLAALITAPITAHGIANASMTPAVTGPLPRAIVFTPPTPPTPQAVKVTTKDNIDLAGTYFEPKRKGGQLAPAALLIHHAGANRSGLDSVAARLQKQGFGVLTVDLRGHGESKTEKLDWSKLDEDSQAGQWALATRDIEAAARWLLRRDEIHSTNLSLVGVGAGSALAVRHATRDENVRCVALLSPQAKEYGFDVEADLQELGGLPTLVLTPRKGTEDTVRMVEAANQMSSPYIEIEFSRGSADSVLEESKTPIKVAKWIVAIAVPKKGRG